MAAVRHLGFCKIRNFNTGLVRRANMCHRAKCCADRSVDLIKVRTTTVSFRLSFIRCDRYIDNGDWTLVRCDRFNCWLPTPLTTAEFPVLYYLVTMGNSKEMCRSARAVTVSQWRAKPY